MSVSAQGSPEFTVIAVLGDFTAFWLQYTEWRKFVVKCEISEIKAKFSKLKRHI